MKRPSIYAKMKVLGAIDIVPGTTRDARIKQVASMTFTDEQLFGPAVASSSSQPS